MQAGRVKTCATTDIAVHVDLVHRPFKISLEEDISMVLVLSLNSILFPYIHLGPKDYLDSHGCPRAFEEQAPMTLLQLSSCITGILEGFILKVVRASCNYLPIGSLFI